MRPRYFFPGNICLQLSVLCLCSVPFNFQAQIPRFTTVSVHKSNALVNSPDKTGKNFNGALLKLNHATKILQLFVALTPTVEGERTNRAESGSREE